MGGLDVARAGKNFFGFVGPPPPVRTGAAPLSRFSVSSSAASVLAAAAGFLQLFHYFVEMEAAGLLPRRILGVSLQVLTHHELRGDHQEGVLDAPIVVISG